MTAPTTRMSCTRSDLIIRESGTFINAKGKRVYPEEYRKNMKAMLVDSFEGQSLAAQERDTRAHPDNIALCLNCQYQQYLQSAGDPCIDFAERNVTQGVKRDINAFALMVQALSGKLTAPEPARPGPSRVHRWLGDEAEDARTLDVGHHDAPAVTDTGAKLIGALIGLLIATASTTTALSIERRAAGTDDDSVMASAIVFGNPGEPDTDRQV